MRFLTAATLPLILFAQPPPPPRDLALVGGTVYADPDSPPLPDAIVVLHDGRIQSVQARRGATIPAATEILDCSNTFITAGFWNSHVHILPPALLHAAESGE